MSTPTVTEILRRGEPVGRDTFIDDDAPGGAARTGASWPPCRQPAIVACSAALALGLDM
jgi:hypothetical protein